MIVRDQLQREIVLQEVPKRIVSLVPSQTELLCYLGLEEQILGVTKFCVHPDHIRKTKSVVGGTKEVHFNKIKKLEPDIILCNKEENTAEMVAELEKIAPVHVSNVITFEDSLELIAQYGELFQTETTTAGLIETLQREKNGFCNSLTESKLKVVYLIWRKPWMAAGGDTFINSLLEINGWENVFKNNKSRYPEVDLKDLSFQNADLVLLSSEPFPFKKKHAAEIAEHFKGRVELVDGEYFSWYGSRLLTAFNYFEKLQKQLSSSL